MWQLFIEKYLNLELNWSILVHNLKNCINVNVGDVRDVSKINIHFTNIGTNRLLSNGKPEIKEINLLASSTTFSSSEHCLFVCSRVLWGEASHSFYNWLIAFVPRNWSIPTSGFKRSPWLSVVPQRLWKLIISQDLRNSK